MRRSAAERFNQRSKVSLELSTWHAVSSACLIEFCAVEKAVSYEAPAFDGIAAMAGHGTKHRSFFGGGQRDRIRRFVGRQVRWARRERDARLAEQPIKSLGKPRTTVSRFEPLRKNRPVAALASSRALQKCPQNRRQIQMREVSLNGFQPVIADADVLVAAAGQKKLRAKHVHCPARQVAYRRSRAASGESTFVISTARNALSSRTTELSNSG